MIRTPINKTHTIKPTQWFYWGTIAAFGLVHAIIYSFFPYSCDDYWYMMPIADYCKGIDTSFPANELWDLWIDHYKTDNIRFANVVFSLFLLVPKAIPSILSGLFVGAMLWQSSLLAGISQRNPLLLTLLATMITFMLPWYEEMFTLCFAFNYVWASALAMMVALMFWSGDKRHGVIISGIAGLLLGTWHEGFAVPLLVGFSAYIVLNRREINSSRVAIMAGMIIGLLWLASAPGLQQNLGYKTTKVTIEMALGKLALYHFPFWILAITLIIAATKKHSRQLLKDPLLLSFTAICATGMALNLSTDVGVRTGWTGYMFGIIANVYLWHKIKPAVYNNTKSTIKKILIAALAALLATHYAVVIYYSIKIRIENDFVLEEYKKSVDGTVFADVTYDYQASPIAWKKPYFEIFSYTWVTYWIDQYHGYAGKRLKVIPTCLRDADVIKGEKVSGDNPFWEYNGYLYSPADAAISYGDIYEIDFGPTKKRIELTPFPFKTSSGANYHFVFPQRATVHLWFGEIKSINRL